MAWSLGNVATNISGIFKDDPTEKAMHDFLKETVFKDEIGFSAGQDFSDDRAEQILDLRIAKMFRGTEQDKIPKSFTEDEKKELVQRLLGEDFDTAPDAAKTYLMEKVSDIVADRFEDKWYQSAGKWAKETAAPAVGSALTTLNSLTPVGWGQEAVGLGSRAILSTFPDLKDGTSTFGNALKSVEANGRMMTERREETLGDIGGFFSFAGNNKARAGELAGQGAVNAFTATGGFVWDTLRFGAYDCIGKGLIGNAAIWVHNIGQDKENKAEYLGTGAFFRHSEWLNKNTQFADPILTTIETVGSDGKKKFSPNENANYERVLLYGPQAVVEVGAVVVASAVTGGAAGAAWGVARGGAAAARTAVVATETATAVGATTTARAAAQTYKTLQQVRNLDAIADAGKIYEKIDKAEKALARAKDTLAQAQEAREVIAMQQAATAGAGTQTAAVGQSGNFSNLLLRQAENRVANAEKAIEKATEKLSSAQRFVENDPKLAKQIQKIKDSGVSVGDYTESTRAALARAESGTSTRIDKLLLRANPENLAQKVQLQAAQAERVGAQVSDAPGVLNIGNPSFLQQLSDSIQIGTYRGFRFANPLRDGPVGKAVNVGGVGLSFGFSVHASQQKSEEDKSDAKNIADPEKVKAGIDVATLNKELANMKAALAVMDSGLPTSPKGSIRTSPEVITTQTQPSASSETPAETERVAGNFNISGSKGAPSSSDPGASQGNTTAFNNRADGNIYIKIDENSLNLLRGAPQNAITSTGKGPAVASGHIS